MKKKTSPLPFKEGDFIDWLHGYNYRSGTIKKIEDEWVLFDGITKTYRIKLKTLLKNYNAKLCVSGEKKF